MIIEWPKPLYTLQERREEQLIGVLEITEQAIMDILGEQLSEEQAIELFMVLDEVISE